VFIDDDEVPSPDWLSSLLKLQAETGATAVVGPVISEYASTPDPWITAGEFFRRRRLPTGTVLDVAATNNLLLDMDQVRALGLDFNAGFGLMGGEDTLFTRQLVQRGGTMVGVAPGVQQWKQLEPGEPGTGHRQRPGTLVARPAFGFRRGPGRRRGGQGGSWHPVRVTATTGQGAADAGPRRRHDHWGSGRQVQRVSPGLTLIGPGQGKGRRRKARPAVGLLMGCCRSGN
jgi:hypothetical protein